MLEVARDEQHADRLAAEAQTLEKLHDWRVARLVEGPITVGGRTALLLESAGPRTLAEELRDGRPDPAPPGGRPLLVPARRNQPLLDDVPLPLTSPASQSDWLSDTWIRPKPALVIAAPSRSTPPAIAPTRAKALREPKRQAPWWFVSAAGPHALRPADSFHPMSGHPSGDGDSPQR